MTEAPWEPKSPLDVCLYPRLVTYWLCALREAPSPLWAGPRLALPSRAGQGNQASLHELLRVVSSLSPICRDYSPVSGRRLGQIGQS